MDTMLYAGTFDIHAWGSGIDKMVSFSFLEAQQMPHHGGMKQNGNCRR